MGAQVQSEGPMQPKCSTRSVEVASLVSAASVPFSGIGPASVVPGATNHTGGLRSQGATPPPLYSALHASGSGFSLSKVSPPALWGCDGVAIHLVIALLIAIIVGLCFYDTFPNLLDAGTANSVIMDELANIVMPPMLANAAMD